MTEIKTQEDASKEVIRMLEVYLEFLNGWHEHEGDTGMGEGREDEPVRMTMADYWEPGAQTGVAYDPPLLQLDTGDVGSEGVEAYAQETGRRIIQVSCTPYHDEGGHAVLTGFFEYDDGWCWNEGKAQMGYNKDPEWYLRAVLQEFDTLHCLIYSDGQVQFNFEPQPTMPVPEVKGR
jgi:hypothetical protein